MVKKVETNDWSDDMFLDKLNEFTSSKKVQKEEDPRFIKIKMSPDFMANGGVHGKLKLRFLPNHPKNQLPFVSFKEFFYKNPTTQKIYQERSLYDLKIPDPASEFNSKLYHTVSKEQYVIEKFRGDDFYITNVLVVKDYQNPENDGKVKLLKFKAQIFKIIQEEKNFDHIPFNPIKGKVFYMQMSQVSQANKNAIPTYASSRFTDTMNVFEVIPKDELIDMMYDLSEFTDPSLYKTYEQLQQKVNEIRSIPVKQSLQKEVSFTKEISVKDDEEEDDDIGF